MNQWSIEELRQLRYTLNILSTKMCLAHAGRIRMRVNSQEDDYECAILARGVRNVEHLIQLS